MRSNEIVSHACQQSATHFAWNHTPAAVPLQLQKRALHTAFPSPSCSPFGVPIDTAVPTVIACIKVTTDRDLLLWRIQPRCTRSQSTSLLLHCMKEHQRCTALQAGLLLALLLQLIFGEFLSRTFRRESSPFLACLAAFCLVHVSLRALLPTVLSPISVTGRLERTQTYTVLGMMFVGAAAFAILLPSGWLDVDVRLGASALKEAGAFWAGVGATLTRMGTMVREGNFRDAGTAADPRRQAAAAEAEAAAAQAAATAAEAQALEGLATADGMENVTTPVCQRFVEYSLDCVSALGTASASADPDTCTCRVCRASEPDLPTCACTRSLASAPGPRVCTARQHC